MNSNTNMYNGGSVFKHGPSTGGVHRSNSNSIITINPNKNHGNHQPMPSNTSNFRKPTTNYTSSHTQGPLMNTINSGRSGVLSN